MNLFSLEKVVILSSVVSICESFRECTSLEEIIILESVKEIQDYFFCGCTSLIEINIPSSVTSIGESAFKWVLFNRKN